MSLYTLKNIKKNYNDRTVLDIPELSIDKGKIYSLSGPNGAGKTTLLNILGFLKTPSTGTMIFEGRQVRFDETFLHQARKKVVLVNQHPILFSTSVHKNIEFGLKVRKIPAVERKPIIESAIELVGMQKFIHKDARSLSGGETRRIAIARALACRPEVILLDEPTADLDPESQFNIETIIQNIHQQNTMSIIFCTHNLSQAERLTHHTIYLLNGRPCDVIHENMFSGPVLFENDQCYCRIGKNVRIPVSASAKNIIKISIHPKSIKIIDPQTSDRANTYPGKVIQLSEADNGVRVSVDIGIPISLMLEKKDYLTHPVHIGDTIVICFEISGVTII